MRDIRTAKALMQTCRQCPLPAHRLPSGHFLKSCAEHLQQDAKRVAARMKKARRRVR